MSPRKAFSTALAFLAILLACSPAHALFRTYLSFNGSDANPCTLPSPCRLLPAALTAVDPGGEIWMLDSANFNTGQVNITKSVSILAVPGVVGSVVATGGGDGININGASVKVSLRNLMVIPIGVANAGVNFAQGAELSINNCEFANHLGMLGAIWVTAPNSKVAIKDTLLRDSSVGVYFGAVGSLITASMDHVRVENNVGQGIWIGNNTRLNVSNSVISGNAANGVYAYAGSSNQSQTVISSSVISGNGTGVFAEAVVFGDISYVVLNQVVISQNGFGVKLSRGANSTTEVVFDATTVSNNGQGINFLSSGAVPVARSRGNNTLQYNVGGDFTGAGAAFTALAAQ